MAYKVFDSGDAPVATHSQTTLQIDGPSVDLPDAAYITDANMMRDGIDLVLEGPDGTIIVEGYFAAEPAPALVAPDGSTLTPGLVDSFLGSEPQYAMTETVSDASPVGAVQEVSGSATVTHVDGSTEAIAVGTPIFEGDVVQTDASGAVNIVFADQTSFAVSEDARLAIDKYVFDPSTQAGETDFSILKGVFVFTSGLIGRDDPDEVHIQTPAGSIGIRGTIIAGNVNTGEITVVEGAIVLRDFQGNEVVLANQFETAKFNMGHGIENMGQVNANDISVKFSSMSAVTPSFFSNIDQTAAEQGKATEAPAVEDAPADTPVDAPVEDAPVAPTDDHSEVAPQATTTMGLANNSGFGNTSGLAPSTSSFSTPTAATMMATSMTSPTMGAPAEPGSAPPPAEVSTATVAGTNTDNSVVDPNTYDPNANNGNGGTTNGAPFSMRSAPAGYFETTSNRDWSFSFNKEFGDPNFAQGDTVTYELSTATINQLNAWQNDGAGGSNDILAASGWNFNATTGQLNLILNGTFSGVTPSTFLSTDIMVRAIDSQGAASGYQTYTFRAYNPFNSMPSGP